MLPEPAPDDSYYGANGRRFMYIEVTDECTLEELSKFFAKKDVALGDVIIYPEYHYDDNGPSVSIDWPEEENE